MATSMDQSAPFPDDTQSTLNVRDLVRKLHARLKSHGVHSSTAMTIAGFRYTGDSDTARCETCHLEVANWTAEMEPFFIHAERNPDCAFVRSRQSLDGLGLSHITASSSDLPKQRLTLVEVKKMKQLRRLTYSHWPAERKPSVDRMIRAGFFACAVGDRTICLYCNLICQQWLPDTDDPSEVHSTLSPHCPYVQSMLNDQETSSLVIANDVTTPSVASEASTSNPSASTETNPINYTACCYPMYIDVSKRFQSFASWSHDSAPSVNDLVRAGFFYTGVGKRVTCFYCNGSLDHWSATDNPTIVHARWFKHCVYAKHLCGDDLYTRIQRAQQGRIH